MPTTIRTITRHRPQFTTACQHCTRWQSSGSRVGVLAALGGHYAVDHPDVPVPHVDLVPTEPRVGKHALTEARRQIRRDERES